jgi:hypothetical protein
MADRMRERYARSEARNEEIRQSLEPLAPGERPGAVTVAAIVAMLIAIANAVLIAVDAGPGDNSDALASGIGLSIVLVAAAVGMWKARYWAVLGFQALLVIQIIVSSAALLGATSWWAALVWTVVIALCGWLFWKLIRAMARIQMPQR